MWVGSERCGGRGVSWTETWAGIDEEEGFLGWKEREIGRCCHERKEEGEKGQMGREEVILLLCRQVLIRPVFVEDAQEDDAEDAFRRLLAGYAILREAGDLCRRTASARYSWNGQSGGFTGH